MLKKISKLVILCVVGLGLMFYIGEEAHAASTLVSGNATFNTSKGNFSYTVRQNEVTITGHDDSIAIVEIPGVIDNMPVTKIGEYAFFSASKLTSITLPDSVTSIGESAFSGASSLKRIDISATSKLKSIGGYAFLGTSSLVSIDIPDSVERIGALAFATPYYGTSSLTNVNITSNSKLELIGESAFAYAKSLKSITLPNGIKNLEKAVFYEASNLETLILPENLESIGNSAFYNVISLKSIGIPASVETIGETAFSGASSLKRIDIPATSKLKSIGGYAFLGTSSLVSIDIPDSVKSIGESAFSGADGLESVLLPEGLESIGGNAFYEARSLKSITIPKGIKSIAGGTFWGARSLKSIDIPEGVESIAEYAFFNSGLKEILISNSKTVIYQFASSDMKEVTVYGQAGSTAETYVRNRPSSDNWSFVAIGSSVTTPVIVTFDKNDSTATGLVPAPLTIDKIQGTYLMNSGGLDKEKEYVASWNTLANGSGKTYYMGSPYLLKNDLTLYAQWKPKKIITWNFDNGASNKIEYSMPRKNITEPTPPMKANHRFAGWYTDTALTIPWDFNNPVTADMILYAKWSYVPNIEPAPAPEILDLSNIGDSSKGIQGTVSPNSYIQIVLNGTELANGRADNEGRFNIEIPPLLAGTELKMIVTNRFGSKKTMFLKVVDQTAPKVTVKPFSDKDTKITGKTEPKAKVKIYINGKLVKTISADAKGNYSYTVPKKKAGTIIKVIATDQVGNATTKTFKVVDKTAPAKPTVKIPTTNSTTLTGKAEPGSMVYVYNGRKFIGNATVNKKGMYTIKIKKQKIGMTLTIYAIDKAKNKSAKKFIKVKK